MNAGAQRITDQPSLAPQELARAIAELAADRKAIDIRELEVHEVLGYTDFFLICSGNTDRQT